MTESTLDLGTRVRYNYFLLRTRVAGGSSRLDRKVWVPMPIYFGAREGIVVGLRTLSNGTRQWGYEDEPIEYKPTEWLKVALVVSDIRKNADRVLISDLEIIGE